jgi:hypothetical protein
MKFPITRESLQAFDQEKENAEKKEEYIQYMLDADIKAICNQLANGMSQYSRDKKFVWREITNSRRSSIYQPGNSYYIPIDEYLPRIIEKLKCTFINCDVISDPLKTYIIIDWS